MLIIIMTIKRRHLRNMALGIKRYELRKTVPRLAEGERCLVLLCESGSGGWIKAEFVMDGWRDLTKAEPGELARLEDQGFPGVQGQGQAAPHQRHRAEAPASILAVCAGAVWGFADRLSEGKSMAIVKEIKTGTAVVRNDDSCFRGLSRDELAARWAEARRAILQIDREEQRKEG